MDLQVAIFLLIFLSISSLATLGICFVELRSCWRNYRAKHESKLRHAAAAGAMGMSDAEFAEAFAAAAAEVESRNHLSAAHELQAQQMMMVDGEALGGAGGAQAGAGDIVYDDMGMPVVHGGRGGAHGGDHVLMDEDDERENMMRGNHILYGEQYPMHGVAPL